MDDVIKAVATLRRAGLTGKKAALPGRAAPARPAPRAIAPASDDDATQPVDYADIISTLEGIVKKLKSEVPVDAGDEADEASAIAAKKSGRTSDAVDRFSKLALRLQAKVTAKKSVNPLLAEKSSPQRAHKLTASGFNADPLVAQMNQALGRGASLTLADRAGMTLAPVGGTRTTQAPPAAVAPVAPYSGYRERVQANLAESKSLDVQMRQSGVFDAKSLARQAELKAENARLIRANSPSRK
jgi:hypothetical protein